MIYYILIALILSIVLLKLSQIPKILEAIMYTSMLFGSIIGSVVYIIWILTR